MNVEGKHYRTIWIKEGNDKIIQIIDQRNLPPQFVIEDLRTVDGELNTFKKGIFTKLLVCRMLQIGKFV